MFSKNSRNCDFGKNKIKSAYFGSDAFHADRFPVAVALLRSGTDHWLELESTIMEMLKR